MSRAPSYFLNGVSLAALGFVPAPGEPGRRSGLAFAHQGLEVPGVAGELDRGFPLRAAPRTVTIAGHVRGTNRDSVLTAIRTILAHAGRGLVELRCVDALDRVLLVERSGDAVATVEAPSLLASQRDGRLTLRFRAAEPAWRDVTPQVLAIGQTAVALPLGELLASPWTLEILGSEAGTVVDPVLHYTDAGGNLVTSLGLTGTLDWGTDATARWWLSTEGLTPRIRRMTAGVWADDAAALASGWFPTLSPLDGWSAGGQYPTLRLEDAGGRATGLLSFTRRHEL